jgi:hypothetical protein
MSQEQKPIVRTKSKGGRPRYSLRSRYGAKIAKALCRAIELGVPNTVAVHAVKISYASFCKWREREEDFEDMVQAAVAVRIQKHLSIIEAAAAKGDFRASAWILEHTNPELFGKNRTERSVMNVGQLNQQFVIPIATLDQIARARLEYEQAKEG